jgi:UDP-N-acetylglucosamine 2-epimerase
MVRVLSIIGTRPEAIKMAPVIRELARHGGKVRSVVCSTGQHREMLDQVFGLFDIKPDIDLRAMRINQSLAELTATLVSSLDSVVREIQPDWILAQGDTTTVLAASLSAYYHRVRFGHVEAGLRTGDLLRPFPEEGNRRIADILADFCFAPTERSRRALLREGIPDDRIGVTGNTVVDALLDIASRPYDWSVGPLSTLRNKQRVVLITAHRRESFGEPFREMCLAIREIAESYKDDGVHFVYPVHLNPNVQEPVGQILSGLPNLSLVPPLDYLSLVHLMKRATLILTDSGGIQEEAPSLHVPVLVMRDTTERPEGVEAGVVKLVGTSRERIVAETRSLMRDPQASKRISNMPNPYGDGHAAERIVSILLRERS